MNTITEFVWVWEIVMYVDPLPLPSDSNYHVVCFLIIKQSRVFKISICSDLQNIPMLLLTVNWNPCDPWAFQLMVYKCGR